MATFEDNDPPNAGEAPGKGPHQSDQLKAERTQHNPWACATCRGHEVWNAVRYDEALIYSLTAGRRICDLQEVGR